MPCCYRKVQFLIPLLVWMLSSPLFIAAQQQRGYPDLIKKGDDLMQRIDQYFFMAVEVNKASAWTGECILATYKLYVALDIQGKVTKAPSYSGFASYDIQHAADSYAVEEIRGTPFKVYTIKKVQLFALRSGIQRLEPVELEAVVRLNTWKRSGISSENYGIIQADTLVPYTLKSQPVQIDIRPLPHSQSENFSGAVGQFQISAETSSNTLAPGETGYFTVKISGSGNWHDIILPKIKWPPGIEVFEPKLKEEIRKDAIPLYEERTLRFPFTVKKIGTYNVPGLIFTFFNPAKDEYQTVETLPLEWTVAGKAVKPDLTKTGAGPIDFTKWFTRIMVVLIPLAVIILLVVLFQRKKNNEPSEPTQEEKNIVSGKDIMPEKQEMAAKSSAFLNGPKKTVESIRKDMEIWKQDNALIFMEEFSNETAVSYGKLYAKAEQMIYGPEPEKAETEQLEAGWRLFKKQNAG